MPDIDDPFLEEVEPTAQQVGIDVPGSRSGFTDFINFGVYNGNFRVGPPDPSADIDVVTAAGSNFVPGWRFVQSSNATITARVVADAYNVSPSGSNVRFTFTNAAIGDQAFFEQLIDMGGSSRQDIGAVLRGFHQSAYGDNNLVVKTQYLDRNGTIIGMPPENSVTYTSGYFWTQAAEVNNPPSTARYLRVRLCATSTRVHAASVIELTEVRRERITANVRMVDRQSSGTGMSDVYQSGSNLFWAPASTLWGTTTTTRLLNYQLIPLTYSLVNIPANAVTNMQLWGDTALALGTPRIGLPWGSSIVGASYRLSAVPTAGGASALSIRVQVGGSTVWTPFTIAGSGGALSSEASQAVGTDDVASGGQIGVVVDTSSTYAPTSADIAVIVWVAVKYDGA